MIQKLNIFTSTTCKKIGEKKEDAKHEGKIGNWREEPKNEEKEKANDFRGKKFLCYQHQESCHDNTKKLLNLIF